MVAVKPGDAARFVKAPGTHVRAILVYGPDSGLVSERAAALAKSYVAETADPFALTRLSGEDIAGDSGRIADEALSIGLFGGNRMIWIRPDGRDIAKALTGLAGAVPAQTRIVVEAGDLKKTSPLRKLFEQTADWAALACYGDTGRDLRSLIEEQARAAGLALDDDATAYLVQHLGGDRLASRMEMEKLCVYCAGQERITLKDTSDIIGDVSALEHDAMIDAMSLGDLAKLDTLIQRQFAAGAAPAQMVSATIRHFLLLRDLQADIARGRSAREVMAGARPPIFFKRQEAIAAALARWPMPAIDHALDRLQEAERISRTGDSLARPGTALIFLGLAAAARRAGA